MHAQPQNCHGPLCTVQLAKRPTYDIASISETTTPINMKFQANIWTMKNVSGDAVLWFVTSFITNPNGGRLPFRKSLNHHNYVSENIIRFWQIWCTTADIERDEILKSTIGPMAWNALPDEWRPPRPVAQCRQFLEEAKDASVSVFRNALGHLAH